MSVQISCQSKKARQISVIYPPFRYIYIYNQPIFDSRLASKAV